MQFSNTLDVSQRVKVVAINTENRLLRQNETTLVVYVPQSDTIALLLIVTS